MSSLAGSQPFSRSINRILCSNVYWFAMEMLPGSGPLGALGSTGVGGASAAVDVLLECGAISASKDVLIGLVGGWPSGRFCVIDVQSRLRGRRRGEPWYMLLSLWVWLKQYIPAFDSKCCQIPYHGFTVTETRIRGSSLETS